MKRLVLAAAAAVIALSASTAAAQVATASGSFLVSATVTKGCTVSALPLSFGSYSPTAPAPLDANTTVTIKCTKTTGYTLTLDKQGGDLAGPNSSKLAYAISDVSSGGAAFPLAGVTGTGTGADESVPLYGRIAAGQFGVDPGLHQDLVTMTVTY